MSKIIDPFNDGRWWDVMNLQSVRWARGEAARTALGSEDASAPLSAAQLEARVAAVTVEAEHRAIEEVVARTRSARERPHPVPVCTAHAADASKRIPPPRAVLRLTAAYPPPWRR